MIEQIRSSINIAMAHIEVQYRKGTIHQYEYDQAKICVDKIIGATSEFESNLHLFEMLGKVSEGEKL